MRVIAGSAGGIPLHTPRTDLRPTMDRVKGAIFSSLGEKIIGARVLDLFAGSGSLGIEALSRGAASATFVENNPRAVETIKRNLEKTRLAGANATVHTLDIFSFLDRLAAPQMFDIVFADPSYAKSPGERDFAPELLASRSLTHTLTPNGIFVLEKLPDQQLRSPEPWELIRARKYGATEVAFFKISASA
jgi:16S rRNA (guanine966-N2)-methyltransferase